MQRKADIRDHTAREIAMEKGIAWVFEDMYFLATNFSKPF